MGGWDLGKEGPGVALTPHAMGSDWPALLNAGGTAPTRSSAANSPSRAGGFASHNPMLANELNRYENGSPCVC